MATTASAPPFTPSKVDSYTSFDDMDLDEKILRGVYGYGFETPTEIQARAVVPILQGKDVIAQAQSGKGKTGTFALGILGRLDFSKSHLQALVLAPTRELAVQIHDVIKALGAYTGVGGSLLCGRHPCAGTTLTFCGVASRPPFDAPRTPVHIVVGTPRACLRHDEPRQVWTRPACGCWSWTKPMKC